MKLENYTYHLPENLIAAHPPAERGASRLLGVNRATGKVVDSFYRNVADFFEPGDTLIINDTRVIKARLFVQKESGAERELVVLERHAGDDDWHSHKVMYRGKIKAGDILTVKNSRKSRKNSAFESPEIIANKANKKQTKSESEEQTFENPSTHKIRVREILGDGLAIVESETDLRDLCENFGTVPLPPYMRRDATALDIERYQTVFADEKGSVAAPTASLNMTEEILETLRKKGVEIRYLTLHVGLGTFMPIRVDDLEKHKMHQEYFEIPAETAAEIRATKKRGGRVFALGTTVARTLEYATNAIFEKSLNGNSGGVSKNNAENSDENPAAEISKISKNESGDLRGEADIFIYPGYDFRTIDGLMTNFHAPKSTVLMLASAFADWDNLSRAYAHAAEQKYHFLSYGDSMIIFEEKSE